MVSATLIWHGLTKLLFIDKKGLPVNAESYSKHLKKVIFLLSIYPRKDWILIQDGASSHISNPVQDFVRNHKPTLRRKILVAQ